MQLPSPDLATIVASPLLTHPKGRYLSVAPRVSVFAGQVNGAPLQDAQTLGIYAFNYDNVAFGSYTDGFLGFSVDIGTTPGARDIATTRVRKAPTASQFFVPETAPALLKIADNQYFTVKREFRPWIYLPRGTESAVGTPYINTITMFIDYDIGYDGTNQYQRPKANITRSTTSPFAPKPAGFVDSGHIYRTMTLSAILSVALADSATLSSYAWDVQDGTITVGGTNTRDITVRFPVGFRWIQLLVVDSNGQQSAMSWPIWVHDATHLPLFNFHITRDVTTDWREMDLDFFAQDTSETAIPQGTALCVWEDDPFHGAAIPDQYRDQTLGYCENDVTLFKKNAPRDTLTVTGLGAWLNRFREIPQRIADPGRVPNSWFEMQNIYLDKLLAYMALNFSNAALLGNIYFSGKTDRLKSLDITAGSSGGQIATAQGILGQMQYIVQGYYGKARYDSLNTLWVRKHYSIMNATERSSINPVYALDHTYWRDADAPKIARRFYHLISRCLGAGASFDGTTQVIFNALAPGRTPADGNTEQDAPGQNLPASGSQDALTQMTGAYYKYIDKANSDVPIPLLPNLDVLEPAWGEPITISTSDSTSGLTLVDDEYLVKSISIAYDDSETGRGAKKITLSTEEVTTGTLADADESDVPVDTTTPVDATPPGDIVVLPIVTDTSRIPAYSGSDTQPTKIFFCDAGGSHAAVAVSWNPTTGTITWINISTGLTGNCIWATADPYDYRRYYILTTAGLYVCSNVWIGSPSWSLVANNTTLFGNSSYIGSQVLMSINRKGWIFLSSGFSGGAVSFDYGSSWTQVGVRGGSGSYGTTIVYENNCSIAVSPFNSGSTGWLYAMTGTPYFTGVSLALYKSTDWGLTWGVVSSGDSAMNVNTASTATPRLEIPYLRQDHVTQNINDASQQLYFSHTEGGEGRINFSNNAGISWGIQQVKGSGGGAQRILGANSVHPLTIWTYDGDNIGYINLFSSGSSFSISTSVDGAVTDAVQTNVSTLGGPTTFAPIINGFPLHKKAFIMCDPIESNLWWTFDSGVTIVTGTYPAFFSGHGADVMWDLSDFIAPG